MTTYSISLDDLDIALLPRSHVFNNFLKKEHYEFEIMKKDPAEEPAFTVLYKCHICALDVPAAFAREHTASNKHRANARIASVAALRTRALITALPPPLATPTGRFCANCATTVRGNHDKTKEHRVAVMHDKLLMELMNAYVGDGDGFSEASDSETELPNEELNDNKQVNGEADIKETSSTKPTAKEVKTVDKPKTEEKINTKTNKEYVPPEELKVNKQVNGKALGIWNKKDRSDADTKETGSPKATAKEVKTAEKPKTEEITNKANSKTNKDKKTDAEKNVKPEATKNQGNTALKSAEANRVTLEHVEFVTKNNELVKVSSDHYHSFVKRDGKTECIVCRTTFKSDEVFAHALSVKHLNLMSSSMIDENCIRKISDVYSHCLLCNQVVKNANVNKHHLTSFHGERKKLAVTGYTKKTFILPESEPKISSGEPYNGFNEAQIAIHNIADRIKRFEERVDNICTEISNTYKINITPSTSTENVQNTAQEKRDENQIEAEEKSKPAKSAVDENKRREEKVDNTCSEINNTSECECSSTEWEHNSKKKRYENAFKANTVEKNHAQTAVAADNPKMTTNNEKENISENGEAKSVVWPVIYPYEVTDQEGCVRCVICDCKVPNTPRNRMTHLRGSNHIRNVKTRRHTYEPCEPPSPWIIRCYICDRLILNTSHCREEHIEENNHVLNAMQLEEGEN